MKIEIRTIPTLGRLGGYSDLRSRVLNASRENLAADFGRVTLEFAN